MTPAMAIGVDVDVTTLDELLPELDQPRVNRFVEVADRDIVIRRSPDVSALLHELLPNTKFYLSWERRRPELKDQSLSGYEMSIAAIAANSGCNAQQICDLLVAFREKEKGAWHGRSYFRSTIGKALGQAARHRKDQQQGAFRQPEDDDAQGPQDQGAPDQSIPENRISKLLPQLNRSYILHGRICFTNVVRRGSCYVACDDQGHEISLGTVREMNAFYVTQANLAEVTGVNLCIPSSKKATYWLPVVERFIAIAHSQPSEFDAGLEEETRAYLARALNALTSNSSCNATRVDLHSSEQLYHVNRSVRKGRRDDFLHHNDPGQNDKEDVRPWPRFIFWTLDGRLCVQVPMLQMFLTTPVGGNERIPADPDRLKQGLAAMGFTLDVIKTGQVGRQKISQRWAISSAAFELDPDCDPQPGLDAEEDREPERQPEFQVGSVVQWVLRKVLQFPEPKPIRSLSPDG